MRLGHLVRTFQQWVNGLQLSELVSEQVFTGLHSITGYITQVPAGGQQFANWRIGISIPAGYDQSTRIKFDSMHSWLTEWVGDGNWEANPLLWLLHCHWCRNGSHVNYGIELRALVGVCLCQSVINHWILDSKRLSGKQIIFWPAIWIWIKKSKHKHKHIHIHPWAFWFAFSSGLNEKRKCHLFYSLIQHPHQSRSAKSFCILRLLTTVHGRVTGPRGGVWRYALVFAYVLCF